MAGADQAPRRREPHAGGLPPDPRPCGQGAHLHRGSALLRARGRGLEEHRAQRVRHAHGQQRPRRVHHHAAGGQKRHRREPGHHPPQDFGDLPRPAPAREVHRGGDPRDLLQPRLLRPQGVRHRGGGGDLLRQARRGSDRRRGRRHRGHHAVPVAVRPAAQRQDPRGEPQPPARRALQDERAGLAERSGL